MKRDHLRCDAKEMKSKNLRVLVVGAKSTTADFLARLLSEHGYTAKRTEKLKFPNPLVIRKFDIIYGIYLQSCSRYIPLAKCLGRKTIIHFIGSDAYWYSRERSLWRRIYWSIVLRCTDLIFYVSPHLKQLVKSAGDVLPLPIDVEKFKQSAHSKIVPDRDILYYCPSGYPNENIYRLDWILEYANAHPEQKITIIGNRTNPAHYQISRPNVLVIPFVHQNEMKTLYQRHKRLIRMTTEDGMPEMLHQAILAGIEVIFNGEIIKEFPRERLPDHFVESFTKAIGRIIKS